MRSLTTTMNHEEPTTELVKELYARFGLAYYYSECLHRELCNFLAISVFYDSNDITRPRIEERLSYAFSLTLGNVVEAIRTQLPSDLQNDLDRAIKQRNFLAHHFWFEYAHLMFSVSGIERMIDELDEMTRLFQEVDQKASSLCDTKRKELGISDDVVRHEMQECKSGKPMEPLLACRKIKRQEKVIRVWEFDLPDVGKPLIFETEDGCLWQLCEVGLGWTFYSTIHSNWTENWIIAQYLPALINPRPLSTDPWNYEFQLSKGAVLWVKKSSLGHAFKWGIRI